MSRTILVAALLLTVVPYFFVSRHMGVEAAWELSAYLSQFSLALLAGNVIACERADRSAEFLAFQGASRVMVVSSKALLCLLVYLVLCTVMIVTRELIPPTAGVMPPPRWHLASVQLGVAATGLAFWGCCWLLSSCLEGPVPAVVLGALVPAIVVFALNRNQQIIGPAVSWWYWYAANCSVLGTTAFIGGTWCYLRRREP